MPTPEFVLALREKVGHQPLWLSGTTAVIVRDDELLLIRRTDNGAWTPITGIIDPGEHPAVAAEREALEEAGVVIVAERLAGLGVTGLITYENGDQSRYLDVVFRCRWVSGEPYPADGEASEARWFPLSALPEMSAEMTGRIAQAISDDPRAAFVR